MCNPDTKIIIDSKDAPSELLNCYFKCVEERDELFVYKLFDQKDNEIICDLSVGVKFNFALGGLKWVLNITASSCEIVKGKWTNSHGNGWEPDQPYQAQAGGTLPVDTSAAAATA